MKALVFYGRLVLSLAVLSYLITMLDWERIKYILPKLRLEYVWQAFILLLLLNLVGSVRWSAVLKQFNIRQRVLDSWRYYMVGGFYGIMLPGVIGGDVMRLGLCIKEHGANKALLTISVLFERVCGVMVILMIAAITALLVPALLVEEQTISIVISGLALTTIISFVLFFSVLKLSPAGRFEDKKEQNGHKSNICLLLSQFRDLPLKLLLLVLLLSALANFFDILGSFFLARSLHIEQPLSFFLLVMPLVYIVTSLPISLGGLGIREGGLTFFLVKAGVMASDAVLLAFLIYLNRILVALIGGLVQLMDKKTRPPDQYESLPKMRCKNI